MSLRYCLSEGPVDYLLVIHDIPSSSDAWFDCARQAGEYATQIKARLQENPLLTYYTSIDLLDAVIQQDPVRWFNQPGKPEQIPVVRQNAMLFALRMLFRFA